MGKEREGKERDKEEVDGGRRLDQVGMKVVPILSVRSSDKGVQALK